MYLKWKIAAALVAMFLFGVIAGASVSFFLRPYFFSPPRPEQIQEHMLSFLTQRLSLTAQQQEQIRPITVDFANHVQAFHDQSVRQFTQLAASTDERLSQYLTPDQKVKLAKLAKERDADFAKHGPPPGP